MMSTPKKKLPVIITACILVVILIIFLYFVFFFNRATIQCNDTAKLSDLMRKDFTDVEITDIQYQYVKDEAIGGIRTQIFVFLKESGDLKDKEYYFDSDGGGISDPNLEHIPSGDIAVLKEAGIELHHIQKHGGNYNQIRVSFSIVPYTIHWYQINEDHDGESNVVLLTSVPRRVSINVDEIIKPK